MTVFKKGDYLTSTEHDDDSIYKIIGQKPDFFIIERVKGIRYIVGQKEPVPMDRVYNLCVLCRVVNNKLTRKYFKNFKEDGKWLIPNLE